MTVADLTIFDPNIVLGLGGAVIAVISAAIYVQSRRVAGSLEAWRETAQAAQLRAAEMSALAVERQEKAELLKGSVDMLSEQLALEQKKTDLTPLMVKLVESDKRTGERHDAMMRVLNELSEYLQ